MKTFDRSALGHNLERADRYHERLLGPEGVEVRDYLDARGIGPYLVEAYKLGICDDVHPGWISIPYLREPHGVAWFNYRRLEGSGPKYKSPGDKHAYNTIALDRADETGEAFICEGEFDAIVATEHYDIPAVGIPGATQWTGNPKFREMFVGYQRVYVLADPDEAGLQLAAAILDVLPAARLVNLPADVTDCWLQGADVRALVAAV